MNKKENNNIIKYIKWDNYDNSKFSRFRKWSKDNEEFMLLYPNYKYTLSSSERLRIRTTFILLENSIKGDYFEIELDNVYIMQLFKFMKSYDEYLEKYVKDNFDEDYKCWNSLISRNGKIKLYLKFNEKRQVITNIINYNVSKKFPKYETFSETDIKSLNRFLKVDKEVRFILEPRSWINKKEKSFGSKFHINTLEVKFKGADIKSVIDTDKVMNNIEKIEI